MNASLKQRGNHGRCSSQDAIIHGGEGGSLAGTQVRIDGTAAGEASCGLRSNVEATSMAAAAAAAAGDRFITLSFREIPKFPYFCLLVPIYSLVRF